MQRDETTVAMMAKQALLAIFSRTLEEEATARRWVFFALLALFFAHLLLVAPALELGKKEQQLGEHRERLRPVEPELDAMTSVIGDLRQLAGKGLEDDLERLVAALDDDLARLEAALAELPRDPVVDGEEAAGEVLPLVAPRSPDEQKTPWVLDDPELLFDLERATSLREVLEILRPLVEERIVRPRFAALERIWKTDFLPRFTSGIDGLASQVPRLRGRFPEAGEGWSALAQALGNARRMGQELEIAPPAERLWWSSTDESGILVLRPVEAIRQQLLAPLALDELTASVDRVGEEQQQLMTRVRSELEGLRQAMAGPVEPRLVTLSELFAAPLPTVALRLFPALLGLLFGVLSWWRTRAIRALGRAASQLEDEPDADLTVWLRDHLLDGGWRVLGGTFLALLWLAAAAVQQVALGDLEPRLQAWIVALGALLIGASGLYRLVTVRSLLERFELSMPGDETLASPIPEEVTPREEASPSEPGKAPPSDGRDTGFLDLTLKH